MTKRIFISADHGMAIAGLKPTLSTWKPIGLTERVGFSRLPRTEAGIYPAEAQSEGKTYRNRINHPCAGGEKTTRANL
jgi:hypothetical protein